TETQEEEKDGVKTHRMKMAWTCRVRYAKSGKAVKQKWIEWRTPEKMCAWIESAVIEKTVLWMFAHNAFFDLQSSGFFPHFTAAGWQLQFYYDQGLTYILVCRKDRRVIKVVSTTNYFACSLAKLGDMAGLPKLEANFETCDRAELSRYCHRDVEIIRAAMESYFAFIRRNDLGSFSMTLPSQSMRAFRHRFMDKKIYIHKHPQVQQLERDAYFGGRTECFQIGKIEGGPVATLDVNSMYPHVMSTQSVPVQLVDYLDQPDVSWLKDALVRHCVVSRCVIETSEPLYAGLAEALKRGHIVGLGETAAYKKAVLFRRFVEELYRLRQEYQGRGDGVWAFLCKKLMNSFYGKWAQRRPVSEVETVVEPEGYRREEVLDLVTGRTFLEYQLMNRRVTIQDDEPANGSFVAISAHITEAARMLLWSLIEQASPAQVLYCDTDSLKLRERDIGNLNHQLHPTKLGKLKVEKVSEDLTIWGLKAYSEGGQWKIKGIPRRAKARAGHVYEYEHFLGSASHMRRCQMTGMISETMVKRLKLVYEKGIVQSDGSVQPFVFGPLDLPSGRPVEQQAYAPLSPLH
ncbi:MAG: DNA polymerase, partial [Candidatus Thorarchaeota archaeon]